MLKEAVWIAAYGFLAHQTRNLVERIEHESWDRLTSYALGLVLWYLAFRAVLKRTARPVDLKHLDAAFSLSALAFGSGTALGWFMDCLRGKR